MNDPDPSTTADSVNAYLAGNLTLATLRLVCDTFVAQQTAAEADAFVRLGERYPAFRALTHGGTVVIGNDPRTRQGEAMRDTLLAACPTLTVWLTSFLPDGEAYVLPPMPPIFGVPA